MSKFHSFLQKLPLVFLISTRQNYQHALYLMNEKGGYGLIRTSRTFNVFLV